MSKCDDAERRRTLEWLKDYEEWMRGNFGTHSIEKCTCGNPELGFNCMCEWMRENPGTNNYMCGYCGSYTASHPRCSKCELEEN